MQKEKILSDSVATIDRYQELLSWLSRWSADFEIKHLAGDASFRRYFRVAVGQQTWVLMDAPAEIESSFPFVAIAGALAEQGVRTPKIVAQDLASGFLLLEDFGDRLYLSELNADNADDLYSKAMQSLVKIAQCGHVTGYDLPQFERERYLQELAWFEQWYVDQYIKRPLTLSQRTTLQEMYEMIVDQALAQPQVLVHKDYHSRNLLLLPDNHVGVIDFQDALIGPITYDLMSLFYDHYIAWPYDKVCQWARYFQQQLLQAGLLPRDDFNEFMRWHDWLALQRIMKNLGNFVRLNLLHNKPGYCQDIPRIYRYLLDITQRYSELAPLAAILRCYQPESLS